MSRILTFALSIVALAAFAPAADAQRRAAPAREPFSFRDWHVGDAFNPEDHRFLRCTPIPAGNACVFTDDRIAGVDARQIGAAFGRDGLFALEAKFPRDSFGIVEAALNDRYGPPCEQRTRQVRNRLLESFSSRVRVWCFSDGRATLSERLDHIDESAFEFATHDADRQAAINDF